LAQSSKTEQYFHQFREFYRRKESTQNSVENKGFREEALFSRHSRLSKNCSSDSVNRNYIPLEGLHSINQSNLIFAPRGKTAVAVLAAEKGIKSTARIMA